MRTTIPFLLFLCISYSFAQEIDTLAFYSKAFKEERVVYVKKPIFYKYKSDEVKLPIIYLLDGQHDWLINPLLSDIEYLQYTHQIPQVITVTIPLKNRVKECGITDLKTPLPLDTFLTKELDEALKEYNPSDYKVIIGHSFSASFSLYSYYHHPDYYAAVIAHSPLDHMDELVKHFNQAKEIDKTKISISIGSIAKNKDGHHRKKYNQLKEQYPRIFDSFHTFEANYSGHNAVPIVSTPSLLTEIFALFSSRYVNIAPVDTAYKLTETPASIDKEIGNIITTSKLGEHFYPPEIPDINGIASRFQNSGYDEYAIKVYELGAKYYPYDYGFMQSLYELSMPNNKEKARTYLLKARSLITHIEPNSDEKNELLKDIAHEIGKNKW